MQEHMVEELWLSGTAEEIKKVEDSVTGQYLSGRKKISVLHFKQRGNQGTTFLQPALYQRIGLFIL